jgi:mono/diheme cytochrome c family protein
MRVAPVSLLAVSLAAASACGGGGGSSPTDAAFAFEQNCAACHSLTVGKPSPNTDAANLAELHPTREDVRRAIIDGRRGMPKGLIGGDNVDQVADYVVKKTAG